jgi:hypothetical protein
MCFRNLFHKPDPVPEPIPEPIPETITTGSKTALLFGIKDYPKGSQNDLRGPLNDLVDIEEIISSLRTNFFIKTFRNSQVTRSCFINELRSAIALLKDNDVLFVYFSGHGTKIIDKNNDESDEYDEAIVVYNDEKNDYDYVIDDDIRDSLVNIPDNCSVIIAFDSCFSDTADKAFMPNGVRKYIPNPAIAPDVKKRISIPKSEIKHIMFAACGEQQTSADAYIDGKFRGAFTCYFKKTFNPSMTNLEWINAIKKCLPSSEFDQVPILRGNESLKNKIVFT